jgi:hypothetical protein
MASASLVAPPAFTRSMSAQKCKLTLGQFSVNVNSYDAERFFPGVVQKVVRGELQFEELPWTVALMVDRFRRRRQLIGHMVRHENHRIALHRRFPNRHVDFPNLEEIHSAPAGTTQLFARHDFPGRLHFCTGERYALVVRATPGMQKDALIYGPLPRSMTSRWKPELSRHG